MNNGQSIHSFLRIIIAYITLLVIFILTINIKLDDFRNRLNKQIWPKHYHNVKTFSEFVHILFQAI